MYNELLLATIGVLNFKIESDDKIIFRIRIQLMQNEMSSKW